MTCTNPIKTLAVVSQSNSLHAIDKFNAYLEGMFTSAFLAKQLAPFGIEIIHICDTDIPQVSMVSILNMDLVNHFHSFGIAIEQLIQPEKGLLSLATIFEGWNNKSDSFYYGSGTYGVPFEGIGFHHFISYLERSTIENNTQETQIDNYSISSKAAKFGRFSLPSNKQDSILSTIEYKLHCDAGVIVSSLENHIKNLGLTTLTAPIQAFKTATHMNQNVESIILSDGTETKIDVVINCGVKSTSYSNSELSQSELMNVATGHYKSEEKCYQVTIHPHQNGWIKRTGVGYKVYFEIYSDTQIQTDFVNKILLAYTKGKITIVAVQAIQSFTLSNLWSGNVLNIGQAAFVSNSPLSLPLHHLLLDCERWLKVFPTQDNMSLVSQLYNRKGALAYEHLQGFYKIPLYLQSQVSSDFWNNQSLLSETLKYQIDLFKQIGVLPVLEEQLISSDQWCSLLVGLGVIPKSSDVLIHRFSADEVQTRLQKFYAFIERSAFSLSTYETFIETIIHPKTTQHVGVKHAK